MYTDRVLEFIRRGAMKHGKLLRDKWLVDPLTAKRCDSRARLQAEKDSNLAGKPCEKELYNYYIAIDVMMAWYKDNTDVCASVDAKYVIEIQVPLFEALAMIDAKREKRAIAVYYVIVGSDKAFGIGVNKTSVLHFDSHDRVRNNTVARERDPSCAVAIADKAISLLSMLTNGECPAFKRHDLVDIFEINVCPGGRVYVVSVHVQNRSMNKFVDVPVTHRSLPAVEYARAHVVFTCVLLLCVCVCLCACVCVCARLRRREYARMYTRTNTHKHTHADVGRVCFGD